MIYDLIKNGFSAELVINLCVRVFIIFCVLPVHECAHAFISHKLGDDTARLKGRMTLNPIAHIDPFGALMIILAGFGWAKPVPVNIRNFKKRKPYMALTAIAGPISNLIMAFLFLVVYFFIIGATHGAAYNAEEMNVASAAATFMTYAAGINVTLAVFNLIPVPPLDGSRILTMLIPDKYYYKIMSYERYITIGIMVLIVLGVFTKPLNWLSSYVMSGLGSLARFPLYFFGM